MFVNYRGEDSQGYGALLYTELARHFGDEHVFLDAESIPAGADFTEELMDRVRSARVLLAVIGSRWLTVTDEAGRRRIDDPADWLRRELAEAFAAGVRVIPVLTDDAELPRDADLPADIAPLSRCQYRRLRRRAPTDDLARIVTDLTGLDPVLAAAARRDNAPHALPTTARPARRSGERMPLGTRLSHRFSHFDRDYRGFLSRTQRFIDVRGLTVVGPYTPELAEVFVDVSVVPRTPADIPTGVLSDDPVNGFTRHVLSDFLDRPEPSVIAIIGGPGTGKTTLLLHTARRACARRGRRTVPILLFLRDHRETIVADPEITLVDVLRSTLGPLRSEEPKDWFDRHLAGGHCVVLLDGLDEVGGQAAQRAVARWVERQICHHPGNDYIITSRPHGYRAARIDGATVLNPLRLTDDQVAHLVSGWFHAFESSRERYNRPSGGNGSTRAEAATRAAASTRGLLERLFRAPELYDLTANPMLLTMIVNVHQFLGQLPGGRADLYAEICRVMLGNRQAAKDLPVEPPVDKKEMVLRGLAYSMMCEHLRDMREDDVIDTIQPLLDRLPHAVTAQDFLTDVGSSGVLVERENGLFAFSHHSFQEYLASAYIREKGLVNVLTTMVDDVWWREVTLLYAAKSDADPIVRACLASSGVAAMSLAFDCDAQSSEIAPDLRLRVRRLLDSAVDPDTDPQLRRLMAGALVARHLRRFVRVNDGGRVCAQPVPVALYRLSLRESRAQTPDEPWLVEPAGDEPVRGVYGREALRFVNWVNTMGAPDVACRLPTRRQLDDPVVGRALHASASDTATTAWLHPAPGHDPELWSPPDHPHPHVVERETLVAHVSQDVAELTTTVAGLMLLRAVAYLPAGTRARAAALASGTRWEGDPLADELARALDIIELHDDTIDVAHARKLLRDTNDDTVLALARSRARSRTRNTGMDIMQSIARVAEKGGADARVPASAAAAAADGGAVNERTRLLVAELAGRLDDVRGRCDLVAHTLALDLAFGQGESLAAELGRYLARIAGLDDLLTTAADPVPSIARLPQPTFTRFVSTWLAEAVSCGLHTAGQPFRDALTTSLIEQLGDVIGRRRVHPDRLADQTRLVTERLRDAWHGVAQGWDVVEVAHRLASLALPVFTWQRPLAPSHATAIRMAALCLAVEIGPVIPELAETLADIAAGVTLLQRRTDGRAQLTETIVLAVS